jgi:transcriptional regulator with XRE-family HTH domain
MTMVEKLEWTLGERLAKARRHAGLNQDEMAEKFGVSHATIAKWEVNKGQPRNFMDRIHQWSEITGVSETWLLGLRGSEMRGNSTRSNRRGRGSSGPGNTRPGGRESGMLFGDPTLN